MPKLGQKLGSYCKVDQVDDARIRRLIKNAPNLEYASLYAFLYLSGVRISEALSLKRQDFSLKGEHLEVKIPRLKRSDHPTIPIRIPLNAPVMGIIMERLQQLKGKVWNMTRVQAWKVLKAIDPKMTLHSFRHSRANYFAEHGDGNPYRLCSWFGWKKLETSMEYMERHGRLGRGLSPLLSGGSSRDR